MLGGWSLSATFQPAEMADDDHDNPFHNNSEGTEATEAAPKNSLLDIHLESAAPVDQLEFQDLPHTTDPNYNDYNESTVRDDQNLLAEGGLSEGESGRRAQNFSNSSFFSLDFYRQFYDVTTVLVLKRLLKSLKPIGPFFNDDDKPDMYGPFWICTTLIFLMAAGGNFADYLGASPDHVWKYNFKMVNWAAWVFYSSITIIPIAVWFALNRTLEKLLVDIITLYGYSFTVYIPACLLCILPSVVLRIIVMVVAVAVSTAFLINNLVRPHERKSVLPVLLGVALCHMGIGFVSYKWFFSFDRS
eukprot:g32247.t1